MTGTSGSRNLLVSTDMQHGRHGMFCPLARCTLPPCTRSGECLRMPGGCQIPKWMEAAMILDDTVGRDVEDGFLGGEAYWLERMPPELEWDESEAALLVEDIVGGSRMRGYS